MQWIEKNIYFIKFKKYIYNRKIVIVLFFIFFSTLNIYFYRTFLWFLNNGAKYSLKTKWYNLNIYMIVVLISNK